MIMITTDCKDNRWTSNSLFNIELLTWWPALQIFEQMGSKSEALHHRLLTMCVCVHWKHEWGFPTEFDANSYANIKPITNICLMLEYENFPFRIKIKHIVCKNKNTKSSALRNLEISWTKKIQNSSKETQNYKIKSKVKKRSTKCSVCWNLDISLRPSQNSGGSWTTVSSLGASGKSWFNFVFLMLYLPNRLSNWRLTIQRNRRSYMHAFCQRSIGC